MAEDLENLIIFPNATNTFDLREDDSSIFIECVEDLFEYYSKAKHPTIEYKNNNGVWVPSYYNPLDFAGFNKKYKEIRMEFGIKDNALYSIGISFDAKPKIAFLNSRDDYHKTKGLYFSRAASNFKPWEHRVERIFIINK